jgi:hypothetical protein
MNIHAGTARNDIYRRTVMSYYETMNHDTSTDNWTLQNMKRCQKKNVKDVICALTDKIRYLYVGLHSVSRASWLRIVEKGQQGTHLS